MVDDCYSSFTSITGEMLCVLIHPLPSAILDTLFLDPPKLDYPRLRYSEGMGVYSMKCSSSGGCES